jgi:hypothetical protein
MVGYDEYQPATTTITTTTTTMSVPVIQTTMMAAPSNSLVPVTNSVSAINALRFSLVHQANSVER